MATAPLAPDSPPYWYRELVRDMPTLSDHQLIVILQEVVMELIVRDIPLKPEGRKPKGPRPWEGRTRT